MIKTPDDETDFFEITSSVLQGGTVAPYFFVVSATIFTFFLFIAYSQYLQMSGNTMEL